MAANAGVPVARAAAADGGGGRVYRLALLSNAMHQDTYARAFAAHRRLHLVAVVDEPGQEPYVAGRNRSMADTYGVPYVESLDALDSRDIDAVSVDPYGGFIQSERLQYELQGHVIERRTHRVREHRHPPRHFVAAIFGIEVD